MRIVTDTSYTPDQKSAAFDSDEEALLTAAKKLEQLQRVVMHQMRNLKDVAPEKAQEEAVKRHVAETSEIVRGLRAQAKER